MNGYLIKSDVLQYRGIMETEDGSYTYSFFLKKKNAICYIDEETGKIIDVETQIEYLEYPRKKDGEKFHFMSYYVNNNEKNRISFENLSKEEKQNAYCYTLIHNVLSPSSKKEQGKVLNLVKRVLKK